MVKGWEQGGEGELKGAGDERESALTGRELEGMWAGRMGLWVQRCMCQDP